MFHSRRELVEFGYSLIELLQDHFVGSRFERDHNRLFPKRTTGWHVYSTLLVSGNVRIELREWARKPAYLILFKGTQYFLEIDLSRAIETNGRFTWYFPRPTQNQSRQHLKRTLKWQPNVSSAYRDALREQKRTLKSGTIIPKSAFCFLQNVDRESMQSEFLEFVDRMINFHSMHEIGPRKGGFEIDSQRALEGYQSDKLYLLTKRNHLITEARKKKDKYTCQACRFRMRVGHRYIIECHHTKPLAGGEVRVTNVNDLISLCPTCHRVAHTQAPPFSLLEIKRLRRLLVK